MPFVTLPEVDMAQRTAASPPDKPVPRPARSPRKSREIRVQNRRRAYIEKHPEYVSRADHELSNPLLYDTWIRKFQTPAEREAEGKRKGWSRVLEGDLVRSEARLADLAAQVDEPSSQDASRDASRDRDGAGVVAVDTDLPAPQDRDEGKFRWDEFLTNRFVRGQDDEFDYDKVDFDDSYDVMERRDAEDAWFEDEDPSWASEPGDGATERQRTTKVGETGVQDF